LLEIDLQLQLQPSGWRLYDATNIEVEDEDCLWWKNWDRIL